MMPSHKRSLLIAEDDAMLRLLLVEAAERSGVFGPITEAPDGAAALTAIQHRDGQGAPELVLSDLSMPRMTGLELLRTLKSDPATRRIPVAIITSSDVPNDRADALAAGAFFFAHKPVGLDALTRIMGVIRTRLDEVATAAS